MNYFRDHIADQMAAQVRVDLKRKQRKLLHDYKGLKDLIRNTVPAIAGIHRERIEQDMDRYARELCDTILAFNELNAR